MPWRVALRWAALDGAWGGLRVLLFDVDAPLRSPGIGSVRGGRIDRVAGVRAGRSGGQHVDRCGAREREAAARAERERGTAGARAGRQVEPGDAPRQGDRAERVRLLVWPLQG